MKSVDAIIDDLFTSAKVFANYLPTFYKSLAVNEFFLPLFLRVANCNDKPPVFFAPNLLHEVSLCTFLVRKNGLKMFRSR